MGLFSFKLPDLGEGIVESEIVEWHVQVGESVAEDQHIADVMTDKATVEVSSPVTGTVVLTACAAGDVLAVGAELIRFEVDGDGNLSANAAAPAEAVIEAVVEIAEEPVVEGPAAVAAVSSSASASQFVFKLPDLGEGIVESEIVEWRVQPGDAIEEDQPIADVMTDKATVEVSSPVTGVVDSVACAAGESLAVGAEMIVFDVAEGLGNASTAAPATVPAPQPIAVAKPAANSAARAAVKVEVPIAAGRQPFAERIVLTSPSVRLYAREQEIDLALVPGTGRDGRIVRQDVDDYLAAGGVTARGSAGSREQRVAKTGTSEVKIKGLRRVIAQRMQATKRDIPHYSYIEEVDVTALEELRQHLNANRDANQPKLTILPFMVQALANVLPQFPACNARFDDTANVVTEYEAVHMGIATMTDAGLMVPVIRHSESLDIWQTATELTRLSQAARDGVAKGDELSGSTITITSLGALGGLATTPVLNAPETSIIGVNKLQQRPVVRNGEIVIRKMMNLSSSFDHRIVDGYDGAQLVQALRAQLENPVSIFV